jgi:hypothetical protein
MSRAQSIVADAGSTLVSAPAGDNPYVSSANSAAVRMAMCLEVVTNFPGLLFTVWRFSEDHPSLCHQRATDRDD